MPILTEITDHNRSCEAQSELLFIMITYIGQLEHPMTVLLWHCYMYSQDCNSLKDVYNLLSLVQLPAAASDQS